MVAGIDNSCPLTPGASWGRHVPGAVLGRSMSTRGASTACRARCPPQMKEVTHVPPRTFAHQWVRLSTHPRRRFRMIRTTGPPPAVAPEHQRWTNQAPRTS